jgi:ketosteroid isomerase-like protein
MATAESNVATVKKMYEAFGRGEIPAILPHLRSDVQWSYRTIAQEVPWYQACRGPAEVAARFFASLDALDFEKFEPRTFLASGDTVAVRLEIGGVYRPTGKRTATSSIHWWTFDNEGKVASYEGYEDTAASREAIAGA